MRDKHKCDFDVNKSVVGVLGTTMNEDVEMSSDNETVDEKGDILTYDIPTRLSLLLHSTLT